MTNRTAPWMIPEQMRRPTAQWLVEPTQKLAELIVQSINLPGPPDDALAHVLAIIRVCAGSPPQGAATATREVRRLLEIISMLEFVESFFASSPSVNEVPCRPCE
eukprot:119196-Amphidinium_carterae.1